MPPDVGPGASGVDQVVRVESSASDPIYTSSIAGGGGLTDSELRASEVPVVDNDVATNTAASATSLSVIDDWDESDRAKVNLIVGQAGVAAGAGSVSATVQRATLASDDPAVTALQIMDDWDESDRAKVNVIAGQAGVAGGSGTSSALTQRVVQATDVPAPSLAVTGRVMDVTDGSTVTVKYASGVATASGDNVVVAAVAGKKIRVLGYVLQVQETAAQTAARFQDATGNISMPHWLTGSADGTSQQGFVVPVQQFGWFQTAEGERLDLNLSAATDVGWMVVFAEVE